MAAPSTTTRGTPTGTYLKEGHPSKIAFARNANVSFWEESSKPPGFDGGAPIKTTTFFNLHVHTKAARTLYEYHDGDFTAIYNPKVMTEITSLINQEGSITQYFSDGSKVDFYGYLQKVDFMEMKEGEAPKLKGTIVVTNWDPVNDVEVLPVYTDVSGT